LRGFSEYEYEKLLFIENGFLRRREFEENFVPLKCIFVDGIFFQVVLMQQGKDLLDISWRDLSFWEFAGTPKYGISPIL
jgi:hypothetical protein